jgi:hypothetical protein
MSKNGPTLHDLVCLLLTEFGDWTPSYHLSKVQTHHGWIGSSGERRARELAEDWAERQQPHEYKGVLYKVERRQNGKYAEYRVLSKPKPRTIWVEKVNAEGQTVRVPQVVG